MRRRIPVASRRGAAHLTVEPGTPVGDLVEIEERLSKILRRLDRQDVDPLEKSGLEGSGDRGQVYNFEFRAAAPNLRGGRKRTPPPLPASSARGTTETRGESW